MVYDCFTFFNELDLLEMRLNILKDVVDKFVICEATYTHRGDPAQLVFQKNRKRFSAFEDKIIYVIVDNPPERSSAIDVDGKGTVWVYENWHRDAIKSGLSHCCDEDTLIFSDIDEIPKPEIVRENLGKWGVVCLELDCFDFYLNYKSTVRHWQRLMMVTYKYFRDQIPGHPIYKHLRSCIIDEFIHVASPQKMRYVIPTMIIPRAGYHFSYLGGINAVVEKCRVQAERWQHRVDTVKRDWLADRIYNGYGITNQMILYRPLLSLRGLPRYIRENKKKYNHLFYKAPLCHCFLLWTRVLILRIMIAGAACVRAVFGHVRIIQTVKGLVMK